jgi:Cu(I)/Ag(I) efflux system membrane fusion protein/cobalt-zinc-cadmium efflux system membrane fusion protein
MNRTVVRTSLVWLTIIAVVAAVLAFHDHKGQGVKAKSGEIVPVAMGPAVSAPSDRPALDGAMDAALAPVQLSQEKMQSIGVKTGTVEYEDLTDGVRATGTVDIDERRVSYVQLRFPGYIREVFTNATYLYVNKGQPLFTVYSPDLVQTQKEYLLAQQNQYVLRGSSVDGVKTGAASLSTAAEDRLRQWNIPESEIAKLEKTGKPTTDVTIHSPTSGYIIERNALPNMYADLSTRLYTIADLSQVWVNAQVFQEDIGRVKAGDDAEVNIDAYPGKIFPGKIESILPQVDMATRTVKVRLEVMNSGLKLKPGMFVNVDLRTNLGHQLVVPASAVFQSGLRQIAFLDHGNGNLEPKEISLGARVGDVFVVNKGLSPHQRIVTSANFLIDSESQLQAASGAPAAPMQMDAAPSAPSAPAEQFKVDFTTNPNPPHKGAGNQLTVKVTHADGTPLTGAEVSVTFCMPAMPEMGMGAINTPAHLSESSGGVYRGSIALVCGGRFQVAVRVKQKEKLVATRQLTVQAEGAM